MIRFVTAENLHESPQLTDSMFRDRATQFHDRLGWNVTVDARGWERDEYDAMSPIYCIYVLPDGSHGGSVRLMPSSGATMLNDHFSHLTGSARIASPWIWEATRFCVAPINPGSASSGVHIACVLMLAVLKVALRSNITHYIGVIDARARRVYRSCGWEPAILGANRHDGEEICAGRWEVSDAAHLRLHARVGHAADYIIPGDIRLTTHRGRPAIVQDVAPHGSTRRPDTLGAANGQMTLSSSTRGEIERLVARYLSASSLRDRRLFEVLLVEGFYNCTLDSVAPQHFETALLAKVHVGMIITICDDMADHPRHRDPRLLAALYRLNVDEHEGEDLDSSFPQGPRRESYGLARFLMHGLVTLVGRLPRGDELLSLLAFDIHQFYQSNRYAALISNEPRLASLNELRTLGPHNMGMVAAWTIDLMASGAVDRSQYGRCREVFMLGQRAGRIINVLVTYDRELAEGDRTNDMIVGAPGLTLVEHRGALMEEFEQLVAEIEVNARAVSAFSVAALARALRHLRGLYFELRGIV